ncbi:MAG: helix-turn-helix transcriptional regulator [Legionellales bacterium]|nr:helix-turn-helix transcriptional regulator [Legionellales bacterium]
MIKDDGTWYEQLRTEALADPDVLAEYEAYRLHLEIAKQLKSARKKAHLSQEKVASDMFTSKSAVARLEAAGGSSKHSPSLSTLARYAKTVGCHLEIKLVPNNAS